MLAFKKEKDEFFDYKNKLYKILKEVKNKTKNHQKNDKPKDLIAFTRKTFEIVDWKYFKPDFDVGIIFLNYIGKNDHLYRDELVELVDRLDINIMYKIIDESQTFVRSLKMIREIDHKFEDCYQTL